MALGFSRRVALRFFESKILWIFSRVPGHWVEPMNTITYEPLSSGHYSSNVRISARKWLPMGMEYCSDDSTLPALITSKNVSSSSFSWQSIESPTVADFTFSLLKRMSLTMH